MFHFAICRTFRVVYYLFIAIFLGSFILLITLDQVESPSNEETARADVAKELRILKTIKKSVQSRGEVDESTGALCQPLHYIPYAETRPVTALASFPGSGNTWLRYLIQQSTGVLTGSQYIDKRLLKKGFPGEPVSNASVAVVKTHEWKSKTRDKFQKAVLLVRSAKPALQSFFNLWGGSHTEFAPKTNYMWGGGKHWEKFFNDYIKEWQSTNLAWIHNFTGPLHIVLYDQLRHELEPTLRSLVHFLDLPLDEAALQCTVEHSEGLFHRRPRTDNFDPYTDEMKKRIAEVEAYVFAEIEKYLKSKPESLSVSMVRFLNPYGYQVPNR